MPILLAVAVESVWIRALRHNMRHRCLLPSALLFRSLPLLSCFRRASSPLSCAVVSERPCSQGDFMQVRRSRRHSLALLIIVLVCAAAGWAFAQITTGTPSLSASVVATTIQSPGVFSIYLQLSNTGTGDAQNVRVNQVILRTLSGTG